MGQASVLPNPLDEAQTTPPLASTDDLLSQIAGEEIDRLLAEGEAEGAAAADVPDAGAEAAVLEAESAREAASLQPVALDELDQLAPKEAALPVQEPAASEASPAPPAATIAQPDFQPPPTHAQPPSEASTPAERAALVAEPEPGVESAAVADDAKSDPLPLYLKPLEWLNAPLAACPECVREAIGKVAIITLINAMAVLVYVMLFR